MSGLQPSPTVTQFAQPAQWVGLLAQPRNLLLLILAGEGLALILSLAPGVIMDRRILFGLASIMVQWVSLGTLAVLQMLRHSIARFSPVLQALCTLLLLLVMTGLVATLTWSLRLPALTGVREDWLAFILPFIAIALVLGAFTWLGLHNAARSRQMAIRTQQAELDALRARIQPHFLFNTLNTGAALVRQQPERAEQLLLDLADLFRAALSRRELIPLSEEIDLTQRYLDIEQLRFGERLQVHWSVPDALPDGAMVPPLALQTLVENAVRHGIEPLPAGGRIDIAITAHPGAMQVRIANPLSSSPQTTSGFRIGLDASRQRIGAMAGSGGNLEARLRDDCHIIDMTLPLQVQATTR